jgi:pimeloyl-ACP methyl ester carboxylesterase
LWFGGQLVAWSFGDSTVARCLTCEAAGVEVPEAYFAEADGASIAWHQYGSGPDVLSVPPLVRNLEILWEHDFYRRFFEYIAPHVRITAFDKRGIGLSDKFHQRW